MDPVNEYIWKKFHIHRGDSLPFSPWLEGACRNHIAELFGELKFKVGAEIGVRTGEFSQVMCEANPGVKMYCIDPWAPYARVSQQRQDRYLRYCRNRLAPYDCTIIKATSEDAVREFKDDSLDSVYIDGRHEFDYVMMDLIMWVPKVRRGGIIAGHDYYEFYAGGVITAVNAYTHAHNIQMWYITRELTPSFFWVKP
jgi:hypothetical protein